MTRRHHPLEGHELEVVRGGKSELIVRHPDTLPLRISRSWTDADGVSGAPQGALDTQLTIAALRDLMRLVDLLADRT